MVVERRRAPSAWRSLDACSTCVASPRRSSGEPGAATSTGSPSSPTRPRPRCCGSPAIASTTPAVAAPAAHSGSARHNAKALMRWLLDRGIDARRAASSTPRSPPTCIDPADARYALADLLEGYTPYQRRPTTRRPPGSSTSAATRTGDRHRRAEALAVSHLSAALEASLDKQGMLDLYRRSRTRWCDVLAKMEHVGIAVDITELRRAQRPAHSPRSSGSAPSCGRVSSAVLNLNSPIQLREILFTDRGAVWRRRRRPRPGSPPTPRRWRSCATSGRSSSIRCCSTARSRSCAARTATGLLAEVAPDGRIHATFNQTVARTGRLSSDRPNLHNIPVRRDEGRQFRRVFIPGPGNVLLVADYNQIELRCIAHLADDPGLIEAFTERPTSTTPPRRGCSASSRRPSRSTSGRRRRWCPTGWPTAWSRTASVNG